MTGHFVESGGIKIHYLDHSGGEPPLVLLPGLSATAPIFEDLVGAGFAAVPGGCRRLARTRPERWPPPG